MSEFLKIDKDERGVVTISLNRPHIHNAFNDQLISELNTEFTKMNTDESVRVVVLSGEGKSFCAGADLNWMKSMVAYTMEENITDSMNLANMFETLNNFSKPLIGKINGAALGGGSGLVAVCDYVIVQEKAKLGFTEVNLGLVPAVISPYVMAKIGHSNSRHLFLTGELFDANKAVEIGLAHQVSLARYFERDVEDAIAKFLKPSPAALTQAKKLIFGVEKLAVSEADQVKDFTCKTIAKMRISKQGQEGMNALLEKRKPNWLEK